MLMKAERLEIGLIYIEDGRGPTSYTKKILAADIYPYCIAYRLMCQMKHGASTAANSNISTPSTSVTELYPQEVIITDLDYSKER